MTKKTFEERKASAENTALWMMADVHRAMGTGAKTLTVKIDDLVEVASYIASIKERVRMEYAGKPVGYCRPDQLLKMLSKEITSMFIVTKKTKRFNTLLSFTEVGEICEPPARHDS